jgi:uncharacterized membrane protein YbhN (UPF0104 family)
LRVPWSRLLGVAAGLGVGAFFLVLSFHGTPVRAVLDTLAAGHWGEPALEVLLATVAFVWAKAARWRLLLGADAPPTIALLQPVTAGLALNALVPHSGEFVRAFALQRRHGFVASAVLSSIVAERVFDLFGVLVLAAGALTVVPVAPALLAAVRLLALVAAVLAAGVIAALALPGPMRGLAARMVRPLPAKLAVRLLAEVDAAFAGLAPVRSPRTSLAVFAWSLVQWLAVAACTAGSAAVAGETIGAGPAILVVVGIVVAFLLPNAPGYAGSVQAAFRVTLVPLGVAPEAALAASFVYQLLMVLPLVVVGLAGLRGSLSKELTDGS